MRCRRSTRAFLVCAVTLLAWQAGPAFVVPARCGPSNVHDQPVWGKLAGTRGREPASSTLRAEGPQHALGVAGIASAKRRFTLGWGGILVLTFLELFVDINDGFGGKGIGRTELESAGIMCVAAAALWVLQDAARRDRLSGGTFRMLSLGALLAFSGLLAHAGFEIAGWFKVGFVTPYPLVFASAIFWTSLPTIDTAHKVLKEYGIPDIKMDVSSRGKGMSKYVCTVLAIGYLVSAAQQLLVGANGFLYTGAKTQGMLRCFVMASAFHVCQTAAVAGPARLSSATYGWLNKALMVETLTRLACRFYFGHGDPGLAVIFPVIGLVSSFGGWLMSRLYKLAMEAAAKE